MLHPYKAMVSLLLFCFLNPPSIQGQVAEPQKLDEAFLNKLWVAHAAFQAHTRNDFITPMLVRAMVAEVKKNPNISYPDLMAHAVALRKEYVESAQYANTGNLSDPFQKEQQIADWAESIAPFSANPLAPVLAKALTDSFKFGSELTVGLTSLDADQQIEYRSYLYRTAMDTVDQTFSDALITAKGNPKFRDALNNFIEPNLGVAVGDSIKDIKRKSPSIVTEFNTEEMIALLKSGRLDEQSEAVIVKKLKLIQERTDASYNLLKQTLDKQKDIEDKQKLHEQIQQQEETQKVEIETARAALSFILQVMGPNASADQRKAVYLGQEAIRAWEVVDEYGHNLRTLQDDSGLAEAAFTFQLLSVMVDIVRITSDQPSETEQATKEILKELNDLKNMVADLYSMTSKRFDRLELLIESYQRLNANAFQILLVRSQISAEDLAAVRSSLSDIHDDIRKLRAENKEAVRSQYDTQFLGLQRKCYLDRITLHTASMLSKEEFNNCLNSFENFALDVSSAKPFIGSNPTTLPAEEIWSRVPEDPYEDEGYLLAEAQQLGSSGARAESTVHNANVWSNSTLAFISTLETWPKLADDDNFKQLRQIINVGNQIETAWHSILVIPCNAVADAASKDKTEDKNKKSVSICEPTNYKLFAQLLKRYSDAVVGLAAATNNTSEKYAAEHSDFINPFAYGIKPIAEITPDDDPEFAKHIPSKIPQCWDDANLPDNIDTPPGITGLIPLEMRLAERLDPVGHQVDLCYDVRFRDLRVVYQNAGMAGWNRYLYFGTPWLSVVVTVPNDESHVLAFSVRLPDMTTGWTKDRDPAVKDVKDLGELRSDAPIPGLDNKYGYYKNGFPKWLSDTGLTGFSKDAVRAYRTYNPEFISTGRIHSIEADAFVLSELQKHRIAAADEIKKEFLESGDQQKALRRLSGAKRQLEVFLRAVLPVSVLENAKLQTVSFANLDVYDNALEWETFLTSGRPTQNVGSYRVRWYSEGFGPPANTPAELLENGIEDLVVIGLTGDMSDTHSTIGQNYRNLEAEVLGVLHSRGDVPERAPVFIVPLGLGNTLLAKHGKIGK